MFTEGRLTRGPGADPRQMPFAAVAVKTTGYEPRRDRIYEVAVVRMRGDGTVLDEYATLVNPLCPVGGDDHDPITDDQVRKAPTFDRIAGDLLAYLSGSVVVAHSLDHVDRFLDAELGRMGVRAPGVPGLCTLRLTRTQLRTYPYRQDNVYRLLTGEWPSWEASALDKARQRARMLHILIGQSPVPLRWHGPGPLALPALPRTGLIAPRVVGLRMGSAGWLANLVAGLPDMNPSPNPNPQGAAEYRSMLGHALADGKIVGDEAQRLALLVTGAGFCQSTIRRVHDQVMLEARARAEEDGVVTSAELRELEKAARNLGSGHLIQDLLRISEEEKARRNGPLKGWRIVPVGKSGPLEEVVEFAVGKGAVVGANVTKTVRLVIAEDGSTDRKVQRAREAGHQVAAPAEAWEVLRAAIERARAGLFDDGRGAAVDARTRAEQERAERARQDREVGAWQERWRPRELTDQEYHAEFVAPHEESADLDNRRIVVTVRTEPEPEPGRKGGGCAGAALLLMATGTAVTTATAQLWPF